MRMVRPDRFVRTDELQPGDVIIMDGAVRVSQVWHGNSGEMFVLLASNQTAKVSPDSLWPIAKRGSA